jgi:hypothetical protein
MAHRAMLLVDISSVAMVRYETSIATGAVPVGQGCGNGLVAVHLICYAAMEASNI